MTEDRYHLLAAFRQWFVGKKPHAKIVVTNGCFDILHAGHVQMLQDAKNLGDYLIVGLNSDKSVRALKGPERPINNQINRKIVLSALRMVDYVCIFEEETCEKFLSVARPHIYVKAGDYRIENINPNERAMLDQLNAQIKFTKFVDGLSTSAIIKNFK